MLRIDHLDIPATQSESVPVSARTFLGRLDCFAGSLSSKERIPRECSGVSVCGEPTTGVFACSIQQGVPGILMSPVLTKMLIS